MELQRVQLLMKGGTKTTVFSLLILFIVGCNNIDRERQNMNEIRPSEQAKDPNMNPKLTITDPKFAIIEFEILNFNHSVAMPMMSNDNYPAPADRPILQDMSVNYSANTFSPLLNLLCVKGQPIEQIDLSYKYGSSNDSKVVIAKELTTCKYVFKECLISSVSIGGGGDTPIESLTFSFKSIEWIHITSKNKVTTAKWPTDN